ncbi:terminase large subunit [Acidaminococcus massiliensis]|mgnify:FL=1|jgi:phage terminase large subunit-like protein|uniref:terminase large subunit n=1 Tax=Acidaminococcus massiliensis TaxID=1852375 RepID=UPI00094E5B34|nr:terminase TerL endonuclease subunit [Acidaminococcus massiliensis]
MKNPAYQYAQDVVKGNINAPKYVKLQCKEFLMIADDKLKKYCLNKERLETIEKLLSLMVMPKGLQAGRTIKDSLAGFQWLLIVAVLCTVYRDKPEKRRYERAVFEICRKNGKTFLIGVIFLLLFFLEPKLSKFYSVAPDGSLSREVKSAIHDIIISSPALAGKYNGKDKFKMLRDQITCNLTENDYFPLNYSTSRLDGKLPNVFLVDEAGALPNPYAIEAMASGQLTILNKLGFIISTKYPTIQNPFEDECDYAKRVLDGTVEDDSEFSLLYEPDNKKDWASDDGILEQSNPLALEVPEIMDDLKKKRQQAIEVQSKRENFITKHCNIIYQGMGTESYISVADLQACRASEPIDWTGREVFLGVDLSMSNDNCSVAMCSYDEDLGKVLFKTMAFIPEGRIEEKNRLEKINYYDYCKAGWCIACGDRTIDYSVIEDYVLTLEEKMGVKINSLGYDRYNAISSAQKWESEGLVTVEIKQHSSVLHPPTKWLSELVEDGKVLYEPDKLVELNFDNARCTYDTNLNRYVNKKKSNGKVDEVVALINAMYLLQQNVLLKGTLDWVAQY